MTLETEAILLICLGHNSTENKENLLANVTQEEWAKVITLAEEQAILPWLYHQIKNLDLKFPGDKLLKLKQEMFQNAARNLGFHKELEEFLNIMNSRGIPIIVLKGMYLADAVYENIGLRTMVDIDILVKDDDLTIVDNELITLGYQTREHTRVKGPDNLHFFYSIPAKGLCLEVHWTLFPTSYAFTIDLDTLWQRRVPFKIGAAPAFALSLEDLILHLCMHTAHHGNDMNIRMFCDLDVLIQRFGEKIDWEIIIERAKVWNAERAVFLVLTLLVELLGVQMSHPYMDLLRPVSNYQKYVDMARDEIFTNPDYLTSSNDLWHIAKLFGSGSLKKKLSMLRYAIYPPLENIAQHYPVKMASWRIYLYYPVRFLEILGRFFILMKKFIFQPRANRMTVGKLGQLSDLREWLKSDLYTG